MRNKNMVKRLSLNKSTIANLENDRMLVVKAGLDLKTVSRTPDCFIAITYPKTACDYCNMVSDHYTACDCPETMAYTCDLLVCGVQPITVTE